MPSWGELAHLFGRPELIILISCCRPQVFGSNPTSLLDWISKNPEAMALYFPPNILYPEAPVFRPGLLEGDEYERAKEEWARAADLRRHASFSFYIHFMRHTRGPTWLSGEQRLGRLTFDRGRGAVLQGPRWGGKEVWDPLWYHIDR